MNGCPTGGGISGRSVLGLFALKYPLFMHCIDIILNDSVPYQHILELHETLQH